MIEAGELETLLRRYPPQKVEKGTVLFKEGQTATHLHLVLTGRIELVSEGQKAGGIEMGALSPGRSANLHALVRNLPYQYSGVAVQEASVLSIPWKVFEPALKRSPAIEPYLKLITEDLVVRSLAKEITEIGCSQRFRVELLGRLEIISLKSQSWVLQQGQVPEFTFLVVNGALQSYQKSTTSKVATLCPVPGRTWLAWEEALSGAVAVHSYRSTGTTKLLGVRSEVLVDLRSRFPEDFAIYTDWVSKAASSRNAPEDSSPREEVDLENLFPKPPRRRLRLALSYPWVRQENQMDCGPACLAMISKFFENDIPIQFWRSQVYTNREGTTLFDLAKGAERNGFSSHGLYVEDLTELDSSHLPAIAVRQYHFVVIYKITGSHVIIGDPGVGIRKMSYKEFYQGFECAVLLLRPTEDFYRVKVPASGYGHYLQLFRGYSREIALLVSCSVLLVIFSLFPPLLMQILMDEVIVKKDTGVLVFALGMIALITLLQTGMSWLRDYYVAYLTSKFDFRAFSSFLRKMFSLPYVFFANRHVGDFTRRLSEMERLREFLTTNVLSTLLSFLTLAIYGIVLAWYSPLIAILTFIVAPVMVGISMLFSKKLQNAYMESFSSRAEEESLLNDLIRGVPTIKSLTAEVAARWRLEEKIVKTLKAQYRFSLTATALGSISSAYGDLARLGLVGLAAYMAIKGDMTPGQVISVSVFVNHIVSPFQQLSQVWEKVQELKSAMTRLNDIFLTPSEGSAGSRGLEKRRIRGEIEFHDVWFKYGGDSSDWVLKGVSFKIEAGQKVAIAGPSGSGKSTVASLLLRLFEPTQGQIFIDGRDYREFDLAWLRTQVGMILQDSHLFHGSISENIAFGDAHPDERLVRESAAMANAHDFVMKKPSGYSYIIAHGGFGLSGGEKQRISCARAFYMNPPILILDEATSALDGVAEKELIRGLLAASRDRSVLSIAHRYTTARHFEQVLLMNAGRVVGFGSHEHLRSSSELYRALFGLDAEDQAA